MGVFNFNPLSEVEKGISNLTKLATKYRTNKSPQAGRSYTTFYYSLFAARNNKIKKVLQVGLGKVESNSLYFWKDYFPTAYIYGVGNDKHYVYKRGRIQTFLANTSNSQEMKNIVKKIGKDVDVVVDEGTRSPREIVSTFQIIMPMLKKDTTYIIENTNRPEANVIMSNLKNYNYNMMRLHRMLSRRDRLIVVKNKA